MGLKKGQTPQGYLNGNLINLRDRSPEERRRIARMGNEAKKKKREQNMILQNTMKQLLTMKVSSNKQKEILKKQGFEGEDLTNQMLLMVALFRKGLTGDVGAIKEITDMMDKLDMYNAGQKVMGQSITINLVPQGTTYEQSKEEEQDIWKAQNGLLEESDQDPWEEWDSDGATSSYSGHTGTLHSEDEESWGDEVYEP